MEKIYRTNQKVITYPIIDIEKGLDKKYRGIPYTPSKKITGISYRAGMYRGVENQVTIKHRS
jgi:hypothetical protein